MTIIQAIERNEILETRKNRLCNMADNPDWNRNSYARKWNLIRRMQAEILENLKNAKPE